MLGGQFFLNKKGHFLRIKRSLLCLLQNLGGARAPIAPRFLRLCLSETWSLKTVLTAESFTLVDNVERDSIGEITTACFPLGFNVYTKAIPSFLDLRLRNVEKILTFLFTTFTGVLKKKQLK